MSGINFEENSSDQKWKKSLRDECVLSNLMPLKSWKAYKYKVDIKNIVIWIFFIQEFILPLNS